MISLTTPPLHIRTIQPGDESGMAAFSENNKEFFYPSGSIKLPEDLTVAYWQYYIECALEEHKAGSSVRFVVFHEDNSSIPIAKINYSQIFRGLFQACYLGYAMDKDYAGKGLMTQALQATINYMFNELNIHRIMANYMPHNKASGRVLEKLGFIIEGTAKDYLRINGQWSDHVLTSLTNRNWREPDKTA